MKRIIAKVVSLMAFVCFLTAAGYSQQPILKADVPFEFSVGKKTFPAGEYQVAQVATHILALRNSSNGVLAVVLTAPMLTQNPKYSAKLRFEVKDGRPVLSEVWTDGMEGYKLFVSNRLPALAQNQPGGAQATTATYVGK